MTLVPSSANPPPPKKKPPQKPHDSHTLAFLMMVRPSYMVPARFGDGAPLSPWGLKVVPPLWAE